jgi:integrase
MSVRKRTWTTLKGERKEAWIVDYIDQGGDRHIETFARKKDADAHHAAVKVEVAQGIHTPASRSITVAEAAEDWLTYVTSEGAERATLTNYKIRVYNHIIPRIGGIKLAALSTPFIQKFRDTLVAELPRPTAMKVLAALKSIIKDARRRGAVAQNVASDVTIRSNSRDKERLTIGRDIPTRDEIRRVIEAAAPDGYARALLLTAAFTGLRASELRGLRWQDVDLQHNVIHVRQRADRYNAIGKPKSAAGARDVPIGVMVVNTLRQWKLASPSKELVFGTRTGKPAQLNNIVARIWQPVQVKAGVVDADGRAKYTGFHSLRHFYASWCINRKRDGGLELPPKVVQTRLGHASITMTYDRYGHLFPSDDGAELDAAERAIFGT